MGKIVVKTIPDCFLHSFKKGLLVAQLIFVTTPKIMETGIMSFKFAALPMKERDPNKAIPPSDLLAYTRTAWGYMEKFSFQGGGKANWAVNLYNSTRTEMVASESTVDNPEDLRAMVRKVTQATDRAIILISRDDFDAISPILDEIGIEHRVYHHPEAIATN